MTEILGIPILLFLLLQHKFLDTITHFPCKSTPQRSGTVTAPENKRSALFFQENLSCYEIVDHYHGGCTNFYEHIVYTQNIYTEPH